MVKSKRPRLSAVAVAADVIQSVGRRIMELLQFFRGQCLLLSTLAYLQLFETVDTRKQTFH